MKRLKIAIVYDRINKFDGAERVLLALHSIWPDAPLFSAVYDKPHASWASIFQIHPSFLQHVPFAKYRHELFAWLTPMAFESFSFDQFDVVLSVTSAEAKCIITKPKTMHICYCLTPTRYLWSGFDEYRKNPNIGLPRFIAKSGFDRLSGTLRTWDLIASNRPDAYIAISETVADRIDTFYHKPVVGIIYPPVDVEKFSRRKVTVTKQHNNRYFLCVSRLVPYKRVDIVIDAFNKLKMPLVIIGDGVERSGLMKRSKTNITFIRRVTDRELIQYYAGARAFVFAGSEDFGIAAVEAQAAGKPVIAYKYGGVAEIVVNGKTGLLFDKQSVDSLCDALERFTPEWYDDSLCRLNAERFSVSRFSQEMKETVEQLYNTYI